MNAAEFSPPASARPAASSARTSKARTTRSAVVFFALHAATWLAAALQVGIDADSDNLLCVALVVASASLTFAYLQASRSLRDMPMSSTALLGLCMTTQWGALVGQSTLWDSLTANLRVPLQTFGFLLGFQLVAIAAHWVTRHWALPAAARRFVPEHLLAPLGIFRTPAPAALWSMGVLGLLATLAAGESEAGILAKVAAAFAAFAWAPFAIPLLHRRHGDAYCRMALQAPMLALFAVSAVLLGLALNARSVMLVGVMTGLLLYGLALLDDDRPFGWSQLRGPALLILLGVLLFEPLTYFMTAVQVARDQRAKISKVEMIRHTWDVLHDPLAVRRERDSIKTASRVDAYDEYYFRSSMLGRLVETKFHDNAFFMVEDVSPLERRLIADDAVDRVLAVLPYPVLKELGLERSKYVTLYSAGDVLANLRLGVDLGGFRTGSMFAQGIAIFGLWTPFLYFLVCIPVFVAWDILARPGPRGGAALMSVVGMLLVYRVFTYGIVTESVGNIAGLLIRNQLQNLLAYALLFHLTGLIWRPFNAPAPADAGAIA